MLDNMCITIPIHLHIIDSCHIRIDMPALIFNLKQQPCAGMHRIVTPIAEHQ